MNENQPNILCISIDSFRADYCSVLNEAEETTPALEKLADSGTSYSKAVSPSTWTLQVHSSIFTGLYPPEHQVLDNDRMLGDFPTFAELLKERGYDTRSFGWNGWLETGDILRGYDHHSTGDPHGKKIGKLRRNTLTHTPRDIGTVDNCAQSISGSQSPFCYFVHLNDTHYPYMPPFPDCKQFTDAPIPSLLYKFWQHKQIYKNRAEIFAGEFWPSESTTEMARHLYRACLRKADSMVDKLVEVLSDQGLLDETIIIVFGDHGDSFGEDGVFGHQFTVSDSVIRVPLIIYDPTDTIPSGASSRVVQLNDLYPTILDVCDIDHPDTNSVSLVSDPPRDAAFVYYSAADSLINKVSKDVNVDDLPPGKQYAIWKSPSEKAVYYPETETWKDDPDDSLATALMSHRSKLREIDSTSGEAVEEDVLKNLEDMGYL